MMKFILILLMASDLTIRTNAAIAGTTKYMEEIKELHQRYVKLKSENNHDEANIIQQKIKSLREEARSTAARPHIENDFSRVDDNLLFSHEKERNNRIEHHKMDRKYHRNNNIKNPKGDSELSDDRSLRYESMSNHKASLLRQRLESNSNLFSESEKAAVEKDISEYLRLEHIVAVQLESIVQDFEKARTMHDKDERMAYLESLKQGRESRQQREMAAREEARKLYQSIRHSIDTKIGSGEL